MRTCATINRIFFDDPDEAYRLFHEFVPDAGEGVQFTPPFNVDYGIGLTIGRGTFLNKDFMVCGGGYVTLGEDCLIGPRCTIATPNHALDAATRLAGWEHASPVTIGDNVWFGANVTVTPVASRLARIPLSARVLWLHETFPPIRSQSAIRRM